MNFDVYPNRSVYSLCCYFMVFSIPLLSRFLNFVDQDFRTNYFNITHRLAYSGDSLVKASEDH